MSSPQRQEAISQLAAEHLIRPEDAADYLDHFNDVVGAREEALRNLRAAGIEYCPPLRETSNVMTIGYHGILRALEAAEARLAADAGRAPLEVPTPDDLGLHYPGLVALYAASRAAPCPPEEAVRQAVGLAVGDPATCLFWEGSAPFGSVVAEMEADSWRREPSGAALTDLQDEAREFLQWLEGKIPLREMFLGIACASDLRHGMTSEEDRFLYQTSGKHSLYERAREQGRLGDPAVERRIALNAALTHEGGTPAEKMAMARSIAAYMAGYGYPEKREQELYVVRAINVHDAWLLEVLSR